MTYYRVVVSYKYGRNVAYNKAMLNEALDLAVVAVMLGQDVNVITVSF